MGMGVKLEVSEKAIDWLAEAGFDPQFGARPIKRAIQRHLLNELSKALIGPPCIPVKSLR
jgi:ATP-dependent Clp protease ATP-binding subunit ClpB